MCALHCVVMTDVSPQFLRRAPLQSMVCELRYPMRLAPQDDATRLQQALAHEYPLPEAPSPLLIQTQGPSAAEGLRYTFTSPDAAHAVLLTPVTLALECRSGYNGWKSFRERWERLMAAAADTFSDLVWQQRIGLRYINRVEVDASDGLRSLEGRINSELLHPLGDESGLFNHINSSIQELRVKQDLGVCTLRHGLRVDDAAPAAYVLDLDYYDDRLTQLDVVTQMSLLDSFNLDVWKMFRWCVTDRQYDEFEPEDPK